MGIKRIKSTKSTDLLLCFVIVAVVCGIVTAQSPDSNNITSQKVGDVDSHSIVLLTPSAADSNSDAARAAADSNGVGAKTGKDVLTTIERQMQKKISVDFRDTPIDDVLRIMADQANVDIIKSPKVTGNVTATLSDVPLEEAMNNILSSHGYAYVASKNMIRIVPIEELTQTEERLISRVYRIVYADVTKLEQTLRTFISPKASLAVSPSTSNIIINDTEAKIKAIDTFIEELDRRTPQILVEVKIYDVTCNEGFDLGTTIDSFGRNEGMTTITETKETTGGSGLVPTTEWSRTEDTEPIPHLDDPFIGNNNGLWTAENGLALRFAVFDEIAIDLTLQILHTQTGAKLLADPRLVVLDNETAEFKIVKEIPYTEQSSTSQGGQMTSTQFKEVGVELKVTPHVTKDGFIRMRVIPKFGVPQYGDFIEGTRLRSVPTVDTRRIDTVALVKKDQTVVLGGLRKKETSEDVSKLPILGDLPLVGILFRNESQAVTTSELIIFITPKIVINPTLSPDEKQAYMGSVIPPAARVHNRVEAGEVPGEITNPK